MNIAKVKALLGKAKNIYKFSTKSHISAWKKSRHMRCAIKKFDKLSNKLVAFIILRNEKPRIPFFLEYYRNLGVDHFIFIDNESTDGLLDYLDRQPDCSAWIANGSYKDANFGLHWVNYLLRRYGTGNWCLHLDPDEFLVYPHIESRNIKELTVFLDSIKKDSFYSLMIDAYSDKAVSETHYSEGENPFKVCPWFDPYGYYPRNTWYNDCFVQGGVRRRVFFKENPNNAPALNKTVLVKWQKNFAYVSSTHTLFPRYLNRPHKKDHVCPTGCLFHFKYIHLFEQKIKEELVRGEHYGNSIEYKGYANEMEKGRKLWMPGSAKFEDWRQMVDLGLMTSGNWF